MSIGRWTTYCQCAHGAFLQYHASCDCDRIHDMFLQVLRSTASNYQWRLSHLLSQTKHTTFHPIVNSDVNSELRRSLSTFTAQPQHYTTLNPSVWRKKFHNRLLHLAWTRTCCFMKRFGHWSFDRDKKQGVRRKFFMRWFKTTCFEVADVSRNGIKVARCTATRTSQIC